MGGFFAAYRGPSCVCCGFRLAWAGVLLAVCALHSDSLVSAELGPRLVAPLPSSGDTVVASGQQPLLVADVALAPGGVLHGVVVSPLGGQSPHTPRAGARVAILREGRLVAEVRSDSQGRFAVSKLQGGVYAMAVAGERGVEWTFCRAWSPGAAPPKAGGVARVALGDGVLRGQGPLPSVKFSEAALMAGVVVGAVAAPIIYHNAQKSNRVPASP